MIKTGTKLLGGLNVALGASLLVGGPDRTSSDSFDTILDLVNNRVWLWGLIFIGIGVICLVAPFVRWGAFIVGVAAGVHTSWCFSFIIAAKNSPRASLTPIAVYGWVAIFHVVAAYVLARDAPTRQQKK